MISDAALIRELKAIVGATHLSVGPAAARRFVGVPRGIRSNIVALQPASLVELWRAARAAVRARRIVVMVAGGSARTGPPEFAEDDGRCIVVISTLHLKGAHLMNGGAQVVCMPGTTLLELGRELKPLQRESQFVLNSGSLRTTVVGSVCAGPGASQLRRGPAYTEAAIYAHVDETGELRLVNDLGIDLGRDPEEQLDKLERGDFERVLSDMHERACSASGYESKVRDTASSTPARWNTDAHYLKNVSGCAGHLVVFAVRLDTFPEDQGIRLFHLATDNPALLTDVRRKMLDPSQPLPVGADYLSRSTFPLVARYGRDSFFAMRAVRSGKIPAVLAFCGLVARFARRMGATGACKGERLAQSIGRFLPCKLPEEFRRLGERYEHHLLIRARACQKAAMVNLLKDETANGRGAVAEYDVRDGWRVFQSVLSAEWALARYSALLRPGSGQIVTFDVALRRNDKAWFYVLPDHLKRMVRKTYVYGHFFCHVFHQSFVLNEEADAAAFRRGMLAHYQARGAACPAEQPIGHQHTATSEQIAFFRKLDPTNTLNAGIGGSSSKPNWR